MKLEMPPVGTKHEDKDFQPGSDKSGGEMICLRTLLISVDMRNFCLNWNGICDIVLCNR